MGTSDVLKVLKIARTVGASNLPKNFQTTGVTITHNMLIGLFSYYILNKITPSLYNLLMHLSLTNQRGDILLSIQWMTVIP